ncbi:multidrug export protein EmrA, partial [Klebsiella pneumoniae]|nr:multidrug export protein EmrA [Klebsiella pneumoniae]
VLVTLDDTDARINFNKAANNLANTVRKIKQMYIADDQYNANVQEAKIAYQQALADYQRRSRLQGAAAISRENMQHAKDAVDSS